MARLIAGHRARWMAVSVREANDADRSRQHHESVHPAALEDGRAGMGRLPRHEANALVADERTRRHPKLIADQQGHTVDVNLNVYTQSSIESRTEAVETLESAFVN